MKLNDEIKQMKKTTGDRYRLQMLNFFKEINKDFYYLLNSGNDLYIVAMELDRELILESLNKDNFYECFIHFYHFLCDLFAYISNSNIKANDTINALQNYYECIKHFNYSQKVQNTLKLDFSLFSLYGNNRAIKFQELDKEVVNKKTRNNKEKAGKMIELHNKYLKDKDILIIVDYVLSFCRNKGEK